MAKVRVNIMVWLKSLVSLVRVSVNIVAGVRIRG